jgi:16S rRNA (cytidine1402-2'-O)-methyltransferase
MTLGCLYVVATPIGNLGDITLRALEILKSVDFVISEDTRTARKLFSKYNIEQRVFSYYSPRERSQAKKYLDMIEQGSDAALISESGTPCISDPGFEIIRGAHERSVRVVPVPGPSAFTAALSSSGIQAKEIFFAGFIPRKKGQRRKYLQSHLEKGYTFVFYESKYRIIDTLNFIGEIAPDLTICAGREITKRFEEFVRGKPEEVRKKIPANVKGEFTVICSPC